MTFSQWRVGGACGAPHPPLGRAHPPVGLRRRVCVACRVRGRLLRASSGPEKKPTDPERGRARILPARCLQRHLCWREPEVKALWPPDHARVAPAFRVRGCPLQLGEDPLKGPRISARGHAGVLPAWCARGHLCRPERELVGAKWLPDCARVAAARCVHRRLGRLRLVLGRDGLVERADTMRVGGRLTGCGACAEALNLLGLEPYVVFVSTLRDELEQDLLGVVEARIYRLRWCVFA